MTRKALVRWGRMLGMVGYPGGKVEFVRLHVCDIDGEEISLPGAAETVCCFPQSDLYEACSTSAAPHGAVLRRGSVPQADAADKALSGGQTDSARSSSHASIACAASGRA